MAEGASGEPFEVWSGGMALRGQRGGRGPALVALHGLTATRRYVFMGSRLLERSGYSMLAYDARGHGESDPAPEPAAYEYSDLVKDLGRVLDEVAPEGAVLAGSSMGAHTALAFALDRRELVRALVLITPAYRGRPYEDERDLDRWDALADGLEHGGVDGFMEVFERGLSGPLP